MTIPSHYLKIGAICTVLFTSLYAHKQVLIMNDDRVLKATASKDGITRISLQGDRIAEVMGFHQDVEFEKDEGKGILFIKGLKEKQNLVMNTENGLFQELELVPSDKSSAQIVLKADESHPIQQSGGAARFQGEYHNPLYTNQRLFLEGDDENRNNVGHHQTPLHLIKSLYNGGGVVLEEAAHQINMPTLKNIKMTYQKTVTDTGFMAHQFVLQNTGPQPMPLSESYFSACCGQLQLIALALKDAALLPKQKTYLYVVVKNG
ncbi:MAG: type-F conjugative transfer system secretin TraK [Alphaproteobacteria bacterium]|nr:type-F conjugative transfer system secretin TraK [Alphaproteobacteria bacterium]